LGREEGERGRRKVTFLGGKEEEGEDILGREGRGKDYFGGRPWGGGRAGAVSGER
jgi:hypothetical protein